MFEYLKKSWLVVLLNEYTSTQITTRIRIPFLEVHSCLWCKKYDFFAILKIMCKFANDLTGRTFLMRHKCCVWLFETKN